MKLAVLVILLGVVVLAATSFVLWLAWNNRASDKVITAIITTAIALVGLPLAVLLLSVPPPVTAVFPAAFVYEAVSKMPPDLPWSITNRRFLPSLLAPNALQQRHPELLSTSNDPESGIQLYHHLLQKSLIDSMFSTSGWRTQRLYFELPTGRRISFTPVPNPADTSRMFSRAEIEKLLRGNKFADVWEGVLANGIVLPVGTKIDITVPSAQADEGKILLTNKFCSVSIETKPDFWVRSIGTYRFLATMSLENSHKLATATYIVRVKASFSRLRAGHPDMPTYRGWVNDLAESLREHFDEEGIWQRTKNDFILHKQLGIAERDGI